MDFTAIDRTTFYVTNSSEVSYEFEVTFNMRSQVMVSGNDRLIVQFPNFDSGFIQHDKQPLCFINDLPYTCYGVPYNDWIVIEIQAFQSVAVASDVILKFSRLRWPRVEKPFPGSVIMKHSRLNG